MSSRRVEVAQPPEQAWERLQAVFAEIGKVTEANPATRSLTGKARYGLNGVRLRVSVLSGAEGTAVLDIEARGQDVLGGAGRKVIDRLVAAI